MTISNKNLKQFLGYFWLSVSNFPMPRTKRAYFIKKAGVRFKTPENPADRNVYFIGKNVTWDSAHPELISVGNNVHITVGCVILSHFMSLLPSGHIKWTKGKVKICDNVFIGANSVISKSVTIGHHSVVGAGSVVTKDIPPCEIWGGVPAKFIKKIEITE